jgi:protein ImuA
MALVASSDALCHLRRAVADLDPSSAVSFGEEAGLLALGLPGVDAALQGGLARGAVHELAPADSIQVGAVAGFALALAALAVTEGRSALWIQTEYAALEAGVPYGPGLDLFGLPLRHLLILRVSRPLDLLWAFEEALKSRSVAAVLAELPESGAAADLTATRRLSLAARAGGGLGLLLRHRPCPLATAAMTRWQVAAAVSQPDAYGGLGRTAFDLSLRKNRRGRCGRWIVCWNHDERIFVPQALSLGVAETAGDGSSGAEPFVSRVASR